MKKSNRETVLITGTSSGIGKSIANHLHSKGYHVIGSSRNPSNETEIRQLALDVTSDKSVDECIRILQRENIIVDILINNAGIAISGTIEDTTLEESFNQFNTNYFGVVRMIKAFIPHMRDNGGGKIINISSMAGLVGLPYQGHYSASKFALEGLVECLRMELKPFNIKMCNILPGDFKTPITNNRLYAKTLSTIYKEQYNNTMKVYLDGELGGGDPIKIAQLTEKLLKSQSSWKVRYIIGNAEQSISVFLKRILSQKSFEKMLLSSFKIK